jgi:hypothetical protein
MADLDELDRLEKVATGGPWWQDDQTGAWRCDEHHAEPNWVGDADLNGSDEALVLALRNAAPELIRDARFARKVRELWGRPVMSSREFCDVIGALIHAAKEGSGDG